MPDLHCTQLTPWTVYSTAPAIHYVATVGCYSSRYTDDTQVSIAQGVEMDRFMWQTLQKDINAVTLTAVGKLWCSYRFSRLSHKVAQSQKGHYRRKMTQKQTQQRNAQFLNIKTDQKQWRELTKLQKQLFSFSFSTGQVLGDFGPYIDIRMKQNSF